MFDMTKGVSGVSIKLKSFKESVEPLLDVIKLSSEIKKFDKIVLKPYLIEDASKSTPIEFVEAVLRYCLVHKNPVADIFIAEGCDGADTKEIFNVQGYKKLAERYKLGLVDLNEADSSETNSTEFLKFEKIMYPNVLKDSFVISMPKLNEDFELGMVGSLSNMLGAFPLRYYKGLFSNVKKKLRKYPIKYAINDINQCKMPNLALIDASIKGALVAGQPLDADKKAAVLLFKDWKSVQYIRLMDEAAKLAKKDNFVIPGEKTEVEGEVKQ
jgi:uncharacterized protein (DUF362 family)